MVRFLVRSGAPVLLVLFAVAVPVSGQSGAQWYASNSEYMQLAPLSPAERDTGWTVAVVTRPADEARSTGGADLADGERPGNGMRQIDGASPPTSASPELTSAPPSSFAAASAVTIMTARLFSDGALMGTEETGLDRSGRPVWRERRDTAGRQIEYERTRYRPDGTIRAVELCDADDRCRAIWYDTPATHGSIVLTTSDEQLSIDYNERGQPAYVRTTESSPGEAGAARPATVVREEWFDYRGGELIEHQIRSGATVLTMRYENTQLVREETRENGRVVELIEWTRDGQGRPVTRLRRTRGTTRTTEWTYNASGAEQEATFENGTLVQRRVTEADGSITVEQYRDGALVIRDLTDSTGTRRREIWSNGSRIRVEE